MRQILCDACGLPITDVSPVHDRDHEIVKVGTRLGWGCPPEDTEWREYHRSCARDLTVADVYNAKGVLPL